MGMQTLTTSISDKAPAYEAPVGKVVRATALGVAIGISLVVGAVFLASPDLAVTPVVVLLWSFVTLICVVVYAVGSTMFRRSSQKPSRRTERWLHHAG